MGSSIAMSFEGIITLRESLTKFADNGWGSGAIIPMREIPQFNSMVWSDVVIEIYWLDWDTVAFRERSIYAEVAPN